MVTTIDDKLELFAKIVFEKTEKDSEQKIAEFTKVHDDLLEKEKQNIIKQTEILVSQMRKKAEFKRNQIISKANIEKQHMVLKKRKELFDRTVNDIRKIGLDFAKQPNYLNFLEKSINNGLSQMEAQEVAAYFKNDDINNLGDRIIEFIEKYKKPYMKIAVIKTDRDILGGCIFEDIDKTLRIDCSIASLIDDNKKLIGKILMDNLQ